MMLYEVRVSFKLTGLSPGESLESLSHQTWWWKYDAQHGMTFFSYESLSAYIELHDAGIAITGLS